MPTLKELEAERQEKMRKLAEMLDRRQRYDNYMYQQEEAERQRLMQERAEGEKQWGNEAAKGATTGLAVGGPWGALIGAGAGAAAGQQRAYRQRRKEGQGRLGAGLKTIFDIPGSLPSSEVTTGLAPAAAEGYAGYQSRTQGMGTKPTQPMRTTGMQTMHDLSASRMARSPGKGIIADEENQRRQERIRRMYDEAGMWEFDDINKKGRK